VIIRMSGFPVLSAFRDYGRTGSNSTRSEIRDAAGSWLENSPKARLWRQRRCGQRVALRQLNLVELGQSGAGDPDVGAPESEGVFLLAFLMSRIRVVAAGLGAVVQLERAEQLRRLDKGPAPASDAGWIVKDHAPGRGPSIFERPAQLVADSFGSLAPIHLHKAHVGERQGPHQYVRDRRGGLGLPE
jgi:hypothetical protein